MSVQVFEQQFNDLVLLAAKEKIEMFAVAKLGDEGAHIKSAVGFVGTVDTISSLIAGACTENAKIKDAVKIALIKLKSQELPMLNELKDLVESVLGKACQCPGYREERAESEGNGGSDENIRDAIKRAAEGRKN